MAQHNPTSRYADRARRQDVFRLTHRQHAAALETRKHGRIGNGHSECDLRQTAIKECDYADRQQDSGYRQNDIHGAHEDVVDNAANGAGDRAD